MVNRGNVLGKLRRLKEAVGSYDRALELRPNYEVALDNRGTMLRQLSRFGEAAETYRRLLALSPDWAYAAGWRLHTQLLIADWTDHDEQIADIEAGVQRGLRRSEPWPFLGWSSATVLQQKCASIYVADRCPTPGSAPWKGPTYAHEWLRAHNATAFENLKQEAERRGVSADRLVIARPLPFDEHLARYAAADLFLDSFPYNAHTTACEALWAGLPIVTCVGEGMTSRIAGGLLTSLGLGELVTHTLVDYEALARRLATSPAELAAIRSRLTDAGRHRALFSLQRYCRHLEAAFETMHARHRQGLLPQSFDVPEA